MSRRSSIAMLASLVMLFGLAATTVLAGGWAEVRPDAAATTEPPRQGEPLVIGFTVLQHGETPAGWVTPTVRFTSLTTGTIVDVAATRSGADGHFSATFTPDRAGYWTYVVTFPELASDGIPVTVAVADPSGVVPAFDPVAGLLAMQGLAPRIDALEGQLEAQRAVDAQLDQGLAALRAAAARDATTIDPGLLVLVVLVAVVAGAAAGFAMAALAGRGSPRQVEVDPALSPAPRGSTPA